MKLTPPSAEYFRTVIDTAGALVVGRRLFDITNGWEGRHPIDVPVFVVTHDPPTDWKPRNRPAVRVRHRGRRGRGRAGRGARG